MNKLNVKQQTACSVCNRALNGVHDTWHCAVTNKPLCDLHTFHSVKNDLFININLITDNCVHLLCGQPALLCQTHGVEVLSMQIGASGLCDGDLICFKPADDLGALIKIIAGYDCVVPITQDDYLMLVRAMSQAKHD